jgi:hypothetical protein
MGAGGDKGRRTTGKLVAGLAETGAAGNREVVDRVGSNKGDEQSGRRQIIRGGGDRDNGCRLANTCRSS